MRGIIQKEEPTPEQVRLVKSALAEARGMTEEQRRAFVAELEAEAEERERQQDTEQQTPAVDGMEVDDGDLMGKILQSIRDREGGMTDADVQALFPGSQINDRLTAYNTLIERSLIQLMGDLANPRYMPTFEPAKETTGGHGKAVG